MLDFGVINVIILVRVCVCACVRVCACVGGVHLCVHAFILYVRLSNPNLRTLLLQVRSTSSLTFISVSAWLSS